uniref:Adenosine receptor A1-like n=1 Tax=Saccoglossus kowalevskii TaxID=10224 RepID=A0ABM0M0M1_SACKO|nr:PREDICTED: adenosine receptor A1-like [Saccoglossus kowalevskii]
MGTAEGWQQPMRSYLHDWLPNPDTNQGPVNFNGICRYELMYDKVWHTLILTTLVVLIPWFVMITLYARIWTIARRQVRAINWEEGTAFKREWKVTKMVALVLGYFVLAWFPMLLFLFFGLSCQCEINRYFRAVGRIMLHSNSAINVVIYGICNPEFRVAFRRILLQVFCCKKVLPNGNVSNW